MKPTKKIIKYYQEYVEELDFSLTLDELMAMLTAYKNGDSRAIVPLFEEIYGYAFWFLDNVFTSAKISIDWYQLAKDMDNRSFFDFVIKAYTEFAQILEGIEKHHDTELLNTFLQIYKKADNPTKKDMIIFCFLNHMDEDYCTPKQKALLIDFMLMSPEIKQEENDYVLYNRLMRTLYFLIPSNNKGVSINPERNKKLVEFALQFAPHYPQLYWNSYCLATTYDTKTAIKCIENTLTYNLNRDSLQGLVKELQSDEPEVLRLAQEPCWEEFKQAFLAKAARKLKGRPKHIHKEAQWIEGQWQWQTDNEYKIWNDEGRLQKHRTDKDIKEWFDNSRLWVHKILRQPQTKELFYEDGFFDYTEWYDDGVLRQTGTSFDYLEIGKQTVYRHPKAKDDEAYRETDEFIFGKNQHKIIKKRNNDGKMLSYHIYDKNDILIDEIFFDKPIDL